MHFNGQIVPITSECNMCPFDEHHNDIPVCLINIIIPTLPK